MKNRFDFISKELDRLEVNHLIRKQNTFSTAQKPRSVINGREMLLFSSSNYLSLSENQDIYEKAYQMAKDYGIGSGGSRLTTGNSKLHQMLEKELSIFMKYESILLFNSGYSANIGVLSALLNEESVVFSDQENHASIIDGCRLSGAKIVVYEHANMKDLKTKLEASTSKRKILVSDGVFSMGGDLLKLNEFINLATRYQALSIVDDAHGIGVLGKSGRGIIEHFDYQWQPDILVGALSKGFGGEGGFIACSEEMKKYLLHKARSYVFSTSLSPFTVASSYCVTKELMKNNKPVKQLQEKISFFIHRLQEMGYNIHTKSAIIKILIGDEDQALEIFNELFEEKIYIPIIRFPAVKKGEAMLRITLMRNHSRKDIQKLLDVLMRIKAKYCLPS